ncbi:Rox3-domain-containing protein [Piedraia hortae CBS 480.64]|uniref:Mediator of RNA polymerase II transcription subunit 19 n=1 Tax=Piedraia hortae CBS 480.64 TaxID=1314780 RepID=A0A6A7C665_9PEZI|nr:Rox3-domain-containing protein [Piedraia hortae CBS 480.64]
MNAPAASVTTAKRCLRDDAERDEGPLAKRQRLHTFTPQSSPETKHQSPSQSVYMSWQAHNENSASFPTPPSTSGFAGQLNGSVHSNVNNGDVTMTDATLVQPHGDGDDDDDSKSDVPRLYRLRPEPPTLSSFHCLPQQDVLELYGLRSIQASVARFDADGNKINRLRKTYAGKVKDLDISGKFEPKKEAWELVGLIDPAWDTAPSGDKTLWQEQKLSQYPSMDLEGSSALLDKLGSALGGMVKGQLPAKEHKHWADQLGPERHLTIKPFTCVKQRASAPVSPRGPIARPNRVNKKRRYDESSYSGYADGFIDDEGGYTTAGDAKRHKTGGLARVR